MPREGIYSTVRVSCTTGSDKTENEYEVCDTFDIGVIGALYYDMYDVLILVRGLEEFS